MGWTREKRKQTNKKHATTTSLLKPFDSTWEVGLTTQIRNLWLIVLFLAIP